MGITALGPSSTNVLQRTWPPIVQLKRNWTDDWQTVIELEVTAFSRSGDSRGVDTATLRRRHGAVKLPWEASVAAKQPWSGGASWWVRILIAGNQGWQPQLVGRIESEATDPHGTQSHGQSGIQQWHVVGPQQILRKIQVSRAYMAKSEAGQLVAKRFDWVPAMNEQVREWWRGDQIVSGNRTEDKVGGVYLYGGVDAWTHRQYVDYLLTMFVDETPDPADPMPAGPFWTLTGQVELLDKLTETIEWQPTQTVAEMLAALIPRRHGLDYAVLPTDDGFAVHVYSLSAFDVAFGDQRITKNPNEVTIQASQSNDITARVVYSEERGYKTVRILGERVVVCGSLCGSGVDARYRGKRSDAHPGLAVSPILVRAWDVALENDYEAETDDAARRDERYRDVYQHLSCYPFLDHQAAEFTPQLDADGTLSDAYADVYAMRPQTLDWLPLVAGVDYTVDPPANDNEEGAAVHFRTPEAWVKSPTQPDEDNGFGPVYDRAQDAGYDLEVTRNTLGINLIGAIPHLLALNHLSGSDPSPIEPTHDYEEVITTLAWQTDQRLGVEWQLPRLNNGVVEPEARPSDGVLEVMVPDAHLWVLSPSTVVGYLSSHYNAEGSLALSPEEPIVLRKDTDRLAFAMAGTLARYYAGRAAAEIVVRGLVPWAGLLTQMLRCVADGARQNELAAPITSIQWRIDEAGGTTTIRTGDAG